MPIDCDDEFWEHPDAEQAFRQPLDKPSKMSFFICFIKLQHITSFMLRTIVGVYKKLTTIYSVSHIGGPVFHQQIEDLIGLCRRTVGTKDTL
jgi:hypothetical protein